MLFKKDTLQKSKWKKLHKEGYHPDVSQIIQRIQKEEKDGVFLFHEWSKLLQIDLDVKDKTVLEIGFGTGSYLAQMIRAGASKVIGFEINPVIIDKVRKVFEILKFDNYEFVEVDSEYLGKVLPETVDIIFEITVFQHTLTEITVNYFSTAKKILKNDGMFICQFLMNDKNAIKQPSNKKEGILYYSHEEIVQMVRECNLNIFKYADHPWRDDKGSYWRIYLLKHPGSL